MRHRGPKAATLALLLAVVSAPAFGGSTCRRVWPGQVGTTCPATCDPYQVCIDSDDQTFNACLAADTWTAIGGAQDVASVFGRTGAVVATSGDYNCSQVTGCPDSVQAYGSLEIHEPAGNVFALSTTPAEYTNWEASANLTNMSATIDTALTGPAVDTLDMDEAGDYITQVSISSSGSTNDKVTHWIYKNGSAIAELGGDSDDRCVTGRQPSTGGALGAISWECTLTLAVNDSLSLAFAAASGTPNYTIHHMVLTATRITDSGGGNIIEVEDGDNTGVFSAIDTVARFDDEADVDFERIDGGAGGPDEITGTIRPSIIHGSNKDLATIAASAPTAGQRIALDSNGNIAPVFNRVTLFVTSNFTSGTSPTDTIFDSGGGDWSEHEDPDGLHDLVTNPSRITFADTGIWTCRVVIAHSTTGTGPTCITLLFNGGVLPLSPGRFCVVSIGSLQPTSIDFSTYPFAVVNTDYIELRGRNQSGATGTWLADSYISCQRQH